MDKELDIIFMCGGYGKRMGSIAEKTQKCMLHFRRRPILEHLLEQVSDTFGRFNPIFAVSHKAEDVIDYFGMHWGKDEIVYVYHKGGAEDKGVLLSVEDYLTGAPFLLIHGNIIFNGEILERVIETQEDCSPLTTWTLAEKVDESNHSILRVDDKGKIVDWVFPPPPNIPTGYYRDMGIYAFNREIYKVLQEFPHETEKYIMGVCLRYVPNADLAAVTYSGEWIHFETPKDLKREDWNL